MHPNARTAAAAHARLTTRGSCSRGALALAFPLSILLIVALGLLERLIALPGGDWSYRHIWPFFICFYFLGLGVSARRYR